MGTVDNSDLRVNEQQSVIWTLNSCHTRPSLIFTIEESHRNPRGNKRGWRIVLILSVHRMSSAVGRVQIGQQRSMFGVLRLLLDGEFSEEANDSAEPVIGNGGTVKT